MEADLIHKITSVLRDAHERIAATRRGGDASATTQSLGQERGVYVYVYVSVYVCVYVYSRTTSTRSKSPVLSLFFLSFPTCSKKKCTYFPQSHPYVEQILRSVRSIRL